MSAVDVHVQTIAEKAAVFVGFCGSGAACAFGLSTSAWQAIGVMGGLFIAVAGFAFNVWLGWRRDQREANRKG
jgi:hypothetical protein